MGPGTGAYGHVSEWLERQQRRIGDLEAENRELRRQLEALRRGIGIAVVVQGRTYPLGAPAPLTTGEYPSAPVGPRYSPATVQTQQPHPTGAFQAAWQNGGAAAASHTANAAADFPEDAWLTGPRRAMPPGPRALQPTPNIPAPAPRAPTPSQQITPQWLRDEQPRMSGPREPATWDEVAAAQGSPGQRAAATGAHPYVRPPVKSRPLTPHLEPVPFESLEQLTGQHSAVRPPASQGRAGERPSLRDSFLLG